jgi:flagellar export protein FliJ
LFYKEKLNDTITLQESVVNEKANEMLQKKQLMIDSHIEKRKFEILRDNKYKKYKQEELKLEQKQNDEFYLSQYNHRG